MKIIPLSEARTHLSRYARLCQTEPVIVTINGLPSFQLERCANGWRADVSPTRQRGPLT